jgi:hypothetical protein
LESSIVSGKLHVPVQAMMFIRPLTLPATAITALRSAIENEGYSPPEPNTVTPSAPFCSNHCIWARIAPRSSFRFLLHGVGLATQKMDLAAP